MSSGIAHKMAAGYGYGSGKLLLELDRRSKPIIPSSSSDVHRSAVTSNFVKSFPTEGKGIHATREPLLGLRFARLPSLQASRDSGPWCCCNHLTTMNPENMLSLHIYCGIRLLRCYHGMPYCVSSSTPLQGPTKHG